MPGVDFGQSAGIVAIHHVGMATQGISTVVATIAGQAFGTRS
jgi:hypothetical protein